VPEAVFGVERGFPARSDLERVVFAAESDPLAARALALHQKRAGRFEEADRRLAALIASGDTDPGLLNNAANVRMALGDAAAALELYERAAQGADSAAVLFNLSHAYGQAIRLEEQDLALAEAQRRDPEVVNELTQRFGVGSQSRYGGADLEVAVARLRERLVPAGEASLAAAALRGGLAPGFLGASLLASVVGFVAVGAGARLLAGRFRASSACARCGTRLCPRCDGRRTPDGLCVGCARLFRRPETIDATLRATRLTELRQRQSRIERAALAVSLLVPGAGGVLAQRPLLGACGAISAAAAASCFYWSGGAVPDPLTVGGAGRLLFASAGTGFVLAYLSSVGLAVAVRWSR
jgi:tetratricopeptide (TPR) repeat protein